MLDTQLGTGFGDDMFGTIDQPFNSCSMSQFNATPDFSWMEGKLDAGGLWPAFGDEQYTLSPAHDDQGFMMDFGTFTSTHTPDASPRASGHLIIDPIVPLPIPFFDIPVPVTISQGPTNVELEHYCELLTLYRQLNSC